jgi:calcineurin-like phosphoesterase family protein
VDERVIQNWQRLVGQEDLILHLGDVAFGFVNLKSLLNGLPGRKILIVGNHDAKSVSYYMSNGFSFACGGLLLSRIYFTHEPAPVLPEGAEFNIHAHCHNSVPEGWRRYPHCRLFALEYTNYEPRQVEKFLRFSNRLEASDAQ